MVIFVPAIDSTLYWKLDISKDHLTSSALAVLLKVDEGLKIWIRGQWSVFRTILLPKINFSNLLIEKIMDNAS